MRVQHILIACLLFLASLSIFVNLTLHIEKGYNVTKADLTNDSDINATLEGLDIFNNAKQNIYNASQHAPGNPNNAQQDPISTTTSISQSAWTTALKFVGQAFTLPPTIISIAGKYLKIDSIWLTTFTIALTIIIVMIIISIPFFNKP
jgi:hypothetical protein